MSAAPGRMIRPLPLVLLALVLAGCLDFTQPRVTNEHRQVLNRVGVVVLLPPQPRLHEIAATATASTTGGALLADWDVAATVGGFLGERLAGKGLAVRSLHYDPAAFADAYDSSVGYPRPERVRERLAALGAGQGVDMVVTVYRQTIADFIGASVEHLVGYGVVRHATAPAAHAFGSVHLEAVAAGSGAVLGAADGQHAVALPAAVWRPRYATEDEALPIDEREAAPLRAAVHEALLGAVRLAAQEAGLSH